MLRQVSHRASLPLGYGWDPQQTKFSHHDVAGFRLLHSQSMCWEGKFVNQWSVKELISRVIFTEITQRNTRIAQIGRSGFQRTYINSFHLDLNFNPTSFSRVAASHDITWLHPLLRNWSFLLPTPLINGTLLNKIICIVTLTHQYFHFWSQASHLFASVSPPCDWAICQKKRTLIHYFRAHVWVFSVRKLKLRHKRNSLCPAQGR